MSGRKLKLTGQQEFMKGMLEVLPSLTIGEGLAKTGHPLKTAEGDDGDIQAGLPLSGPRFVNFEDGTVYDNVTGLMWVANPNLCAPPISVGGVAQDLNWFDAIDACEACEYAGHKDWRLPNINELMSLFFIMVEGQHIDWNFFTVYNWYYWSSTTYVGVTTAAWLTEWIYGLTYIADKTGSHLLVLPVRGGHSWA